MFFLCFYVFNFAYGLGHLLLEVVHSTYCTNWRHIYVSTIWYILILPVFILLVPKNFFFLCLEFFVLFVEDSISLIHLPPPPGRHLRLFLREPKIFNFWPCQRWTNPPHANHLAFCWIWRHCGINAIWWDQGNPLIHFSGSFGAPLQNPVLKRLTDFQHANKLWWCNSWPSGRAYVLPLHCLIVLVWSQFEPWPWFSPIPTIGYVPTWIRVPSCGPILLSWTS